MSSIDPLVSLFEATARCNLCAGDTKILRDERTNLPQPGFVGPGYKKGGLLLIGQNPGAPNGEAATTVSERNHVEVLQAVAAGEVGAVARLNSFLADYMRTWRIYDQLLTPLLELSVLTLEDVAYVNLVRCRTRDNAVPSQLMVTGCRTNQFEPWLRALEPAAVVCLGKETARSAESSLRAHGVPYTVVNRVRSMSNEARRDEIRTVTEFIRPHLAGRHHRPLFEVPASLPLLEVKMENNHEFSPSLGGEPANATPNSPEPVLPAGSRGAEAAGLRVEATPATAKYWRLDIYAGDKHIGEYERSIPREIDRKRSEVRLAADILLDVFTRRGPFQVRYNSDTKTKEIRVNGIIVGTVPRDCWLAPTR